MRHLRWLIVGVLLVVVWAGVQTRKADTATRDLSAVLDQFPESRDMTDTVIGDARRYRLPPAGRLAIRVDWGEGAWDVYDRKRLED